MALPLTLVPIGGFFENTLGEFSLFTAEVQLPGAETQRGALDEDWINVARDFGVLGDGTDETVKMQAALDAAATGPKTKVLIPAGMTVLVSVQNIDNCRQGYWGPMWYALAIDSGVVLRIDGTLKLAKPTTAQTNFFGGAAVIANRNSFRVLFGSGGTTAYNNNVPSGFTGDLQGYINSAVHNNSTPGTALTFTNSPDLSGVAVGAYEVFPVDLYIPGPIRLAALGGSANRQLSELVSVDNGAKTAVVTDAFVSISAASPRAWYIENNLVDEDITIEGHGTIDCDSQNGATDWDWVFAFRMARCRNLKITGIHIVNHNEEGMEIVLSEWVKIDKVTFEVLDLATAFVYSDISLDVCSHVTVSDCNFIVPESPTELFTSTGGTIPGAHYVGTIGVFSWATRNLIVKNCRYVNHMNGVAFAGIVGLVQLQGYGQNVLEGHGTIWGFLDEREDNRIIWKQASTPGDGSTNADASSYREVDWNCLIDGNYVMNNAAGMTLLGETFFGVTGNGIKVVNNYVCNNEGYGIGLGTCKKILIKNNTIKNNGWANASFNYR